MIDITIRSATQADLPTLLEFEQGIISFERPFDPTLKNAPISYYNISEMIEASDAEVVVAEYNNRLIGSGFGHIVNSKPYLKHAQYVSLRFMYVDADFRGKGVNQLVMQALKKWSNDKGINELRLTVYSENYGAIKAYEKAGFSHNMIEMRIDLEK